MMMTSFGTQAGSRYEIDDYLGANHFLRAATTVSSCAFSGFTKMRYMAQRGAFLTCTSNRQTIAYTLICPVTIFSEMKCLLLDTTLRYLVLFAFTYLVVLILKPIST